MQNLKGNRNVPEDLDHQAWAEDQDSTAAPGAEKEGRDEIKRQRLSTSSGDSFTMLDRDTWLPVQAEPFLSAHSPTDPADSPTGEATESQPGVRSRLSYDKAKPPIGPLTIVSNVKATGKDRNCLLYTSDAADE